MRVKSEKEKKINESNFENLRKHFCKQPIQYQKQKLPQKDEKT